MSHQNNPNFHLFLFIKTVENLAFQTDYYTVSNGQHLIAVHCLSS